MARSATKDSPKANGVIEVKPGLKVPQGNGTPKEMDPQRQQALDRALSQIDKTFGKGSIMRLDEEAYLATPGIGTGSLSLDLALGGRGIPRGRIVEIFGPEKLG